MKEPKFQILGDLSSKPGAVYISDGIEGNLQSLVDITIKSLSANDVEVTPEIIKEIEIHFQEQQKLIDQQWYEMGIPEKLIELLGYSKKSKLIAYCKRTTISENELFLLLHNASLLGYSLRSKFPQYIPDNLPWSDIGEEPRKAINKLNTFFEQRKYYMIHMLEKNEKWHCFYYTSHDMDGHQWEHGPHLHFVNYLWSNYRKRQVWESFDNRKHSVSGQHIRLIPVVHKPYQLSENTDDDFNVFYKSLLAKYKSK